MEKEFIPYEEALDLKELGFEEECIGVWDNHTKELFMNDTREIHINDLPTIFSLAPLYQQALKFLLEKIPSYSYRMCYNDTGEIYNPDSSTYDIFNDKDELIIGLLDLIKINK